MSEFRHGKVLCWHCDRLLDAATPLGDPTTPKKGDITLCLYCGVVSVFDIGGQTEEVVPRCPTKTELDALNNDTEFKQQFFGFAWARQMLLAQEKGQLSLIRDREDLDS